MRIDMHVHTRGSFDCLSDPRAVVLCARQRGIDRVCITDHNEIAAALELKAEFPEHVIVGEEVKTAERVDIIGLFMQRRIAAGTPARETCALIREQGGIVYVPHPFARGKGGGGRILEQIEEFIDVIEGFNARIHSDELNRRAVAWAESRGLPVGAGSDAHTLGEIGRGWVEVAPFADSPAALLDALRTATTGGRLSSRTVHVASTWAKLRKRTGIA